ncbi:hypothetical protein [Deferrisoma palaeochoriense]
MRGRVAGTWVVLALALNAAAGPGGFPVRAGVGLVPKEFRIRPVEGLDAVRGYAEEYIAALGLEGVRVHRVARSGDRYFAYVREADTGRGAFALEISADGRLGPKRFPGMDPEMMWNQKYGHRARRDPDLVRERLGPEEALSRARQAVPPDEGLRPGGWEWYYGYVLAFLFDEAGRWAGEAAVNTVNGEVVWARFPGGPPEARPPVAPPEP